MYAKSDDHELVKVGNPYLRPQVIPTLLLWGTSDGILPVQLAYEAKDVIDLDDDCFYIFQKSGHSPHYEETDLFNRKVNEFSREQVL